MRLLRIKGSSGASQRHPDERTGAGRLTRVTAPYESPFRFRVPLVPSQDACYLATGLSSLPRHPHVAPNWRRPWRRSCRVAPEGRAASTAVAAHPEPWALSWAPLHCVACEPVPASRGFATACRYPNHENAPPQRSVARAPGRGRSAVGLGLPPPERHRRRCGSLAGVTVPQSHLLRRRRCRTQGWPLLRRPHQRHHQRQHSPRHPSRSRCPPGCPPDCRRHDRCRQRRHPVARPQSPSSRPWRGP